MGPRLRRGYMVTGSCAGFSGLGLLLGWLGIVLGFLLGGFQLGILLLLWRFRCLCRGVLGVLLGWVWGLCLGFWLGLLGLLLF